MGVHKLWVQLDQMSIGVGLDEHNRSVVERKCMDHT